MPEYNSWRQLAGYFDGDGTIYFSDTSNRPYKLSISLIFVDQSVDQIRTVRDFLNRNGIRTSNILKRSDAEAYQLAVSEFKSVRATLGRMIPFLYKKEIEARAALDYYEGKITGNQLLAVFNAEVDAGRRERKIRTVKLDVPYTRPEGDRIMNLNKRVRMRDAFGRYRSVVTPKDFERIRRGHFDGGKRPCDLAREYPRYSKETIRRILGRDRGCVGVIGIGTVDTTDTTIREPKRPRTERRC